MGEDIAVVGLAGRFPGAGDVATLWRNLCDGIDAIHDYTDDELAACGIGPRLLADPTLVRAHGRLAGVSAFDAESFGMTADAAAMLDPQHRLFLEQCWVALDDAGCDPTRYPGTVAVYSGCSANRYFLFHLFDNPALSDADADDWEGRLLTGTTPDHLPTQVAYRLGLTGPAVAVQAACASSLVAICHAAQSLAEFRCDLALAGGVAVTSPRSRQTPGGLLSSDGRCRAFDASAQGSGLGSGVAVVALKRLEDARIDHDRVYAVLRGWAVNNDGHQRAGYAAPGVAGQTGVVVEALESADIPAASIGLVEAHASGTPIGDAIEVAALAAAFDTEDVGFCALGSVKTNIGNLDAATGAVGLIKAVCAVRDGIIPASLHFDRPNPQIDFSRSPFVVPVKTQPWPARPWPRRAGVSSFGLGGTNAHVIVEQPPDDPRPPELSGWHLLLLSARTPAALRAAILNLRDHLAQAAPDVRLGDVAHTLAVGRSAFSCRAAVLCRDLPAAVAALTTLAETETGRVQVAADEPASSEPPPLLATTAEAWVHGTPMAWAEVVGAVDWRVVSLPSYPFQRRRHWIDPPVRGRSGAQR